MENEGNVWFNNNEGASSKLFNGSIASDRPIEPYLTVLSLNEDDNLLLGACHLGGVLWTGSLWLFKTPETAPNPKESVAAIEMDVAASDTIFYDKTHVIAADYSGHLLLLLVKGADEDGPIYFTRLFAFEDREGYVVSMDSSPSPGPLVAGYSDGSIVLWDVHTHLSRQIYSPAHRGIVSSVKVKPQSDSEFASTSHDGLALLWDIRVEKPAYCVVQGSFGLSSIGWMGEDSLVLGDLSGCVRLFDARNRKIISSMELSTKYPVQRLRINQEKKWVAVAIDKPAVHVLSYVDGNLNDIYSSNEHTGLVRGMAWSQKTDRLHTCGWDTQVLTHSMSQT